jgi:hypothetical protein
LNRRSFLQYAIASGFPSLLSLRTSGEKPHSPSDAACFPAFSDITTRSGVDFRHEASHTTQKYLIETMGSGVALLDYDGDGYLDIFLVNCAALQDPMPPGKNPDKSNPRYWNRLYHNNGNGTFTDVTEKAGVKGNGYGMGVAVGDYDNDGHPDIYVTSFGSNTLYHNNGDGTFTDVTEKAGVMAGGWSTSAAFLDYDRDGRLDLAVVRYLEWDFGISPWCGDHRPGHRGYCHPDEFRPVTYFLYRNNGDGTFNDVSQGSGFGSSPGKGLGIAFNDFDGDGWLDIVVANDSYPQQFFKNNRDGTFAEQGTLRTLAYDDNGSVYAGMGVDASDFDGDGRPDVFVTALSNQRYAIYHNTENAFEYDSDSSGLATISRVHSGWGTKFIDYDNDGWKDLVVAQGHVMDNIELTHPAFRYLEPMLLMRNIKGKFQNMSSLGGSAFGVVRAGRGAAIGDLDNDGFMDLVVNCNGECAVVLRNEGKTCNHWLLVNTVGTVSNRDGMGAKLRLVSESGFEQHSLVTTSGSYLSASDKRVHFGLGSENKVRLLEIVWPSGIVQRMENLQVDRIINVVEPAK